MTTDHQTETGRRTLIQRIELSNAHAVFFDSAGQFSYGPSCGSWRHGQVGGIRNQANRRVATRLRCAGRAQPKSADGQCRQLNKIAAGEISGFHLFKLCQRFYFRRTLSIVRAQPVVAIAKAAAFQGKATRSRFLVAALVGMTRAKFAYFPALPGPPTG